MKLREEVEELQRENLDLRDKVEEIVVGYSGF